MSQSSADNLGNSPPPRRGRRYKKASKKAESILDAGEAVPGISPDRKLHSCSADSPPPLFTTGDIARGVLTARAPDMASRARSGGATEDNRGLGPDNFAIYFWKVPRPTDFLNLPDSRKRCKADVDRAERQKDIDDGSNDWDGFDNDLPDRGIASCFTKRAKRSFWAGKTWMEFETQERSLNLQTLDGGRVAETYTLDNARRMNIFEALKERLCEEIWLQPYVGVPSRNNSKPAMAPNARSKNVLENLEPSKQDRADGIDAWSRTREGVAEPWYAVETVNPAGLEHMMQYYRAESMAQRSHSSQRSRLQQRIVPQIEYTSVRNSARANNAAEDAGRPANSSASHGYRRQKGERDVNKR